MLRDDPEDAASASEEPATVNNSAEVNSAAPANETLARRRLGLLLATVMGRPRCLTRSNAKSIRQRYRPDGARL
jgi:hypothetical protein